jgi:hypothetical protein
METLNRLSVGTITLGSAALVTGTALLLLNRARAYHIDADELDRRQGLAIAPLLDRGANGVLITLQY